MFLSNNLNTLKTQLNELNKKIQELEIRAILYSERDWVVVKECDAKLATLNAKYLDLDDKIQTLERNTVNTSNDSVCLVGATV